MKEAAFVKNNKQKWLRYEEKLKHQRDLTPDELAQLYIDLTDDLPLPDTLPGQRTGELFKSNGFRCAPGDL